MLLRKLTKGLYENSTQCRAPPSVSQRGGEGTSSCGLIAVTMARVETSSSRPYHLVIFGASGFTGQFVVEEVARTASEGPKGNLKWAVAGRSKQKLEKVLEQAAGVLSMYLTIPLVVYVEADYSATEITYQFI